MNEVFVIEKMVAIGVWELLSTAFYTDMQVAIDAQISINKKMKEMKKSIVTRITTLKKVEK